MRTLEERGMVVARTPEGRDTVVVTIGGEVVFHGTQFALKVWRAGDTPAGLDPVAVQKSIEFNQTNTQQGRSYIVPLPNWDHPLHVGSFVKAKSATPYVVVEIHGTWLVIVPVNDLNSPPACAYTVSIESVTVITLKQALEMACAQDS